MTRARSIRVATSLLTAACALCGCGQAPPAAPAASESAAQRLERVSVGPPVRKTLTLNSLQPASLRAFETTPLYSKIAGYVETVHVDIGDRVAQGQALVSLWVPELHDEHRRQRALVEQAEAEVRQAQAAVTAAESATATAGAQLAGAEAGVTKAAGDYARWKSESDRISKLVEGGVVSSKVADETLNQLRAAEGALAEARAAITAAEAYVAQMKALVLKAQADVSAAQARQQVALANLAQAETMLGYTQITAPYDGAVIERNVDTRHYVHPAGGGQSRPLLTVSDVNMLRVFVEVPEMEAGFVTSGVDDGDPVTIRVQALEERTFDGRVRRTSWSLDPQNRSLRVEIDLPNPDGVLRPGMYATAQLQLEEVADALTVPATAIVRDGAATFCCVVENGVVARRPVELGLRVGPDIEVRSGLSEQDSIVLARAGNLQPGQSVEVVSTDKK